MPQVGIELIGADSAAADAEVMLVAAEAIAALGLPAISLDLTLPTLVPTLLEEAHLPQATNSALAGALDRKDAAEVTRLAGPLAVMLTNLLLAAGPAEQALNALRASPLPPACRPLAERLEQVVTTLRAAAPALQITIDPLEFRGYRYHTGLAFSIFVPGCAEEVGRGGRYVSEGGEPATGVTLYADALLRTAGLRPPRPTLYVPAGQQAAAFRAQGFATLAGLAPVADDQAEAIRLGCSHVLRGGEAQTIIK